MPKSEPYQHLSDAELLTKYYEKRDNTWLGILLQRYTLLLLGTCMKYLKNEEAAKDAVQQIFLKAISELQKYEVQYVRSWLYMVAKNYCLMQLRSAFVTLPFEYAANEEQHDDADEWTHLNEREVTLDLLETTLAALNAEQKTCVTMFYLQKKSYADIVSETGYSLLQVKSYIQNGKRNLRILMEQKMNRVE